MATFKGRSPGDNVYVLANYPGMNLGAAQVLARNGDNSEKKHQGVYCQRAERVPEQIGVHVEKGR